MNTHRADLGLPQFDVPPAEPVFSPNPLDELVATSTGGKFTVKLRVSSPPVQYTLVQGAAPVRNAVRYVHHFPFLGVAAAPERRIERHHRALRRPLWRSEGEPSHLDSHLPAH